jgi:hypothetical protein
MRLNREFRKTVALGDAFGYQLPTLFDLNLKWPIEFTTAKTSLKPLSWAQRLENPPARCCGDHAHNAMLDGTQHVLALGTWKDGTQVLWLGNLQVKLSRTDPSLKMENLPGWLCEVKRVGNSFELINLPSDPIQHDSSVRKAFYADV